MNIIDTIVRDFDSDGLDSQILAATTVAKQIGIDWIKRSADMIDDEETCLGVLIIGQSWSGRPLQEEFITVLYAEITGKQSGSYQHSSTVPDLAQTSLP